MICVSILFNIIYIHNTAGEIGPSPLVMYSYGPLDMGVQKQGDQLETTCSSSVRIRGCCTGELLKRLTIGRWGKRGSGISVLIA